MTNLSDYYNNKKAQLATLVKMAKADDAVMESERMLLKLVAFKLDISESEFEEIFENAEKYHYSPPITEEEKIIQYYILIQMMKVDLNIDQDEISLYRQVGKRMYLPDKKIEKVLELLKEKEREIVGIEEVRAIIKNI